MDNDQQQYERNKVFKAFNNILGTELDKSISYLISQGLIFDSKAPTKEEKISFAKARLDYFQYLFEQEIKTRESLEKKGQFFLSLMTILLGAIFVKFDSLKLLGEIIHQKKLQIPTVFLQGILLSLSSIGVLLIVNLVSVVEAINIRDFPGLRSKDVVRDWFDKDSWFNNEERVISGRALLYAAILEKYYNINQQKAKWLRIASYSTVGLIIFSAIFLGLAIYLSIQV